MNMQNWAKRIVEDAIQAEIKRARLIQTLDRCHDNLEDCKRIVKDAQAELEDDISDSDTE